MYFAMALGVFLNLPWHSLPSPISIRICVEEGNSPCFVLYFIHSDASAYFRPTFPGANTEQED